MQLLCNINLNQSKWEMCYVMDMSGSYCFLNFGWMKSYVILYIILLVIPDEVIGFFN
jgi:hypothetical protein